MCPVSQESRIWTLVSFLVLLFITCKFASVQQREKWLGDGESGFQSWFCSQPAR